MVIEQLQQAVKYRAAEQICEQLRKAGHAAYFAGGCVRDLLLDREPKDYDVATSAVPAEVLAMFERTQAVGAHFGVVLVLLKLDGEAVLTEVATFRNDGAYSDGRRPGGPQRWTTQEGWTTLPPELSGPSATQFSASQKTSCGCCGVSALPRDLTGRLSPRLCGRCRSLRRVSMR
jgi:hypothetical protein